MGIRNVILGGTDFSNGEVLYDYDLNDTNDRIINNFKLVNAQRYGDSVVSGCEVTEQGTPDQTVQVSSGTVLIDGLYYSVSADASVSLSAADATNPRWDIISVGDDDTITVTDGTAAATPVVPTLPTDHSPLAVVYRAANDNVIGTADIKDCRRLIDIPFFEVNDTQVTENENEWTLKKTITIPAFRCQKYFDIEFDISAYLEEDGAYSNQGEVEAPKARASVNSVVEQTVNCTTAIAQFSTDGETFQGSSGVGKVRIYATDYDFTQPVTVTLEIYGHDNVLGSSVAYIIAVNNVFAVDGV